MPLLEKTQITTALLTTTDQVSLPWSQIQINLPVQLCPDPLCWSTPTQFQRSLATFHQMQKVKTPTILHSYWWVYRVRSKNTRVFRSDWKFRIGQGRARLIHQCWWHHFAKLQQAVRSPGSTRGLRQNLWFSRHHPVKLDGFYKYQSISIIIVSSVKFLFIDKCHAHIS